MICKVIIRNKKFKQPCIDKEVQMQIQEDEVSSDDDDEEEEGEGIFLNVFKALQGQKTVEQMVHERHKVQLIKDKKN